jgi:hypothetical protein
MRRASIKSRARREWEAQRAARSEREPKPPHRLERPVVYTGGTTVGPAPKTERAPGGKSERKHKNALAALGCVLCRRLYGPHAPGPVELHHLRTAGWGRGDYTTLIPLCREHHRGDSGVHGLGTKGFSRRYGITQADLLMDALTLIAKGIE